MLIEKQKRIDAQWREAKIITKQGTHVTCGCGNRMPLRFAHRCLYCYEFYCEPCAEAHFGKTRAEYLADKEAAKKSHV